MADCEDQYYKCGGHWDFNDLLLVGIGEYNDGSYATYNDERGFFMIGGMAPNLSDKFVSFNSSTASFEILELTTKHGRFGHSTVIIPDNDIRCE